MHKCSYSLTNLIYHFFYQFLLLFCYRNLIYKSIYVVRYGLIELDRVRNIVSEALGRAVFFDLLDELFILGIFEQIYVGALGCIALDVA